MPTLDPIIILCGGRSTRMGCPKGLVTCAGEVWLTRQLQCVAVCGANRVVVVLGFQADVYRHALPWIDAGGATWVRTDGVQVRSVTNEQPNYGPFSSIQAAARLLLPTRPRGAFVLPIDTPCPTEATWQRLHHAAGGGNIRSPRHIRRICEVGRREPRVIDVVQPSHQGRPGHPVWLAARFLQHLLTIDPADTQARLDRLIALWSATRVVVVAVDDAAVLENFNTPEAMRAWPHHTIAAPSPK